MFVAFVTTLEQMTRILMFLLVGFFLNRLNILPKGAGAGISKLSTHLFLPALLIYNSMTEFNPAQVSEYGRVVLLGLVFWAIVTLLSIPTANRLAGGDAQARGVYLYGLSFPNTGAVGTPLALALLGTAGLFQFNLFMLAAGIMTYAWGVGLFMDGSQAQTDGRGKRILRSVFNSLFIAKMLGLLLGAVGAKNWIPTLVTDFMGELGSYYAPISLIASGYAIADYPLKEMFNRPKSYLFTFLRLAVIPFFALGLAWLAKLSLLEATLVIFAFACPSGMNVVVFPASYGRECKTGASIVLLSNLGSILMIPVLYALVQRIFG